MAAEGLTPVLSHFGISVFDIERMKDFYTNVFGFKVNDEGPGVTFNFRLVFLSSRPDVHHELVLAENRPADCTFSTVMQLSFKVQNLEQLRAVRAKALKNGAQKMRGLNHGNALSIYFADPEDNTIEVYLDTPWYVPQPHGDPLDLDLPDDEIWKQTEAAVRADPGFMLETERQQRFRDGTIS